MSTATPTAVEQPRAVTLSRVIRSEWTKLWSLRSTRWTLLVAFIAQAGLGPLVCAVQMAHWDLADRLTFNAIDHSLAGHFLAEIAVGVLGVLVISGEYSSGQIKSSMMAVPRRLPLLWAKLIVFFSVSFVLVFCSALIAFFASQAILTKHHANVGIGSPDAFRCVIGVALSATVIGALCTGLGTMIRATAGGITSFVVLLFVVPPLFSLLPNSISNAINPYLLFSADQGLAESARHAHTFSPWGSFVVIVVYAVLAVGGGAVLLMRRDA